MTRILKILTAFINELHDIIVDSTHLMGFGLTDKQLHFWLLGAFGIFVFLVCDMIFKKLAKWSISAISFIYAFTVLVVVVLAIEIEQKVTQSGKMEFADVTAGLSGFLVFSALYFLIMLLIKEIKQKG
ncbi:MAG: hypothetical protein ACM3ZR_10650 [Pseudomonadota bacterium]